MDEEVFFNPGNAITSDVDPKEVIRTAQITADQRVMKDKLVMVKDRNGQHLLFEIGDQNNDQSGKKYHVEKKF